VNVIVAAVLALAGCEKGSDGGPAAGPSAPLTELGKQDLTVGKGPGAQNGDVLILDYTGTLADGTKFDSNKDRDNGAPFAIFLGAGKVIKGWDQGLVGMKEGGTRKLSIPPSLGYGDKDAPGGKIPANSNLFFEITLDKIVQKADVDNPVLDEFTKHGTGPKAKNGDTVTIQYKGHYANKVVFDPGDKPFSVKLGSGGAIQGMEYALVGRQVGDTFRLTVPPVWGYGQGNGTIPANSWLIFDIQVTDIKH